MSTVTPMRYGHGGLAEEFSRWEGPYEDMEQVKAWCGNRVQFVFGKLSPEQQIDCTRHMVAFWQYTRAFCEQRQREPQDDLTSDLAAIVSRDPSALSMHELASIIFGLGFAGHETTTSLIGNAMRLGVVTLA